MQWLANLCNHSPEGQRSLEDPLGIFGKMLRALGHSIVWDPKNDKFLTGPGTMNLIVEGFTDSFIEVIATAHAQGARFVILATEEPTARGFNQGTQPEMVMRQKTFPLGAKYADGILHLVPGDHVTQWFSQFAPTAYVELGYAPDLVRRAEPRGIEPPFDFGFYGSMSKRRMQILKRLAKISGKEKAVRIMADFRTQDERDAAMREAKVIVQIRKFEAMGLVSSSRCNTALMIGRPVLAEPHLLSHPWDEVVTFTKTLEGFYDVARLMRFQWQSAHAAQFDRFKTMLTPEWCVGRALKQIGLDA